MDENRTLERQIAYFLEGFLASLEEIARENLELQALLGDWERVIQWRVGDHGSPFLMIVKDQQVFFQGGLDSDPDLSIRLNPADTILRLLSGKEDLWEKAIEERSMVIRGDGWDVARLKEVVSLTRGIDA